MHFWNIFALHRYLVNSVRVVLGHFRQHLAGVGAASLGSVLPILIIDLLAKAGV